MANEKRLIDANALIASLRESLDELRRIGDGLSHHEDKQICNGQICTFLEAIMRVREQPTVDAVEVVHGRWIVDAVEVDHPFLEFESVWRDVHQCSMCKEYFDVSDARNYCPNCGAKMDGGNEDV